MALAQPGRVLIADDHAPTRALVRHALERGGFIVEVEAESAAGAVAGAEMHHPDLALLDIRMPGGGINAARAISSLDPAPAIVMLTVSEDEDDLFDALRAGAAGYLLKGMGTEELPQKLEAVLAGEASLSGRLVSKLIEEYRRRDRKRLFVAHSDPNRRLTSREWEVLELMDGGLNTAQIAGQLFVNPVTVRSHVAAIVKKLRVGDRKAAVELLRRSSLPSPSDRYDL